MALRNRIEEVLGQILSGDKQSDQLGPMTESQQRLYDSLLSLETSLDGTLVSWSLPDVISQIHKLVNMTKGKIILDHLEIIRDELMGIEQALRARFGEKYQEQLKQIQTVGEYLQELENEIIKDKGNSSAVRKAQ